MQTAIPTLWDGAAVTGILMGAYVVETVVHEMAHYYTALAVGVRPTALCLFTNPAASPGWCFSFELRGMRVEIGAHPLRYFVCFDEQHPVWKRAPSADGSLARAGRAQIAAIALSGPLVHVLAGAMFGAVVASGIVGPGADWVCRWVIVASTILATVNLTPVGPSDGAHAFNALLRRPPQYGRKLFAWEEWTLLSMVLLSAAIAVKCLFD